MPEPTSVVDGFRKRVEQLRTAKGLSQEQLADRCGMHQQTLSKIELKRRGVGLEDAIAIAHGLGVPLRDLLPEVGPRSPNYLSRRRAIEVGIRTEEKEIDQLEVQLRQLTRQRDRRQDTLARMRARLDALEATEE